MVSIPGLSLGFRSTPGYRLPRIYLGELYWEYIICFGSLLLYYIVDRFR
jgi:hypothetical protein